MKIFLLESVTRCVTFAYNCGMKVHQTFRLDSEVQKKAQQFAKEENRTISNFYSNAVIAYVLLKESLKPKKK